MERYYIYRECREDISVLGVEMLVGTVVCAALAFMVVRGMGQGGVDTG